MYLYSTLCMCMFYFFLLLLHYILSCTSYSIVFVFWLFINNLQMNYSDIAQPTEQYRRTKVMNSWNIRATHINNYNTVILWVWFWKSGGFKLSVICVTNATGCRAACELGLHIFRQGWSLVLVTSAGNRMILVPGGLPYGSMPLAAHRFKCFVTVYIISRQDFDFFNIMWGKTKFSPTLVCRTCLSDCRPGQHQAARVLCGEIVGTRLWAPEATLSSRERGVALFINF